MCSARHFYPSIVRPRNNYHGNNASSVNHESCRDELIHEDPDIESFIKEEPGIIEMSLGLWLVDVYTLIPKNFITTFNRKYCSANFTAKQNFTEDQSYPLYTI